MFYNMNPATLAVDYHISEDDAKKLVSKQRSDAQDKAFLVRLQNKAYINEHPFSDYAKGMQQVSPIRSLMIKSLQVDGTFVDIRVYKQLDFLKGYEMLFNTDLIPYKTAEDIHLDIKRIVKKGEDFARVCECKLLSRRKKKSITLPKIYTLILFSLNKYGISEGTFFTATFSDYYLRHSTKAERRKAIREWAEMQGSALYIANIDYGKKNGREHYHILFTGRVDVCSYRRKFHSMCFVERVFGDWEHLAYYETKLTSHAVKETTKDPGHSSMMVGKGLRDITSMKKIVLPIPYFDTWEIECREKDYKKCVLKGKDGRERVLYVGPDGLIHSPSDTTTN